MIIGRSVLVALAPVIAAANVEVEVLHKPDCSDGKCKSPKEGDWVKVHYVGMLENGTEIESSRKKGYGKPFEFRYGADGVLPGWNHGIKDMVIGEKRKLTIPPEFAYGDVANGPIPPNSTLKFELELMKIAAPNSRLDNSYRFVGFVLIVGMVFGLAFCATSKINAEEMSLEEETKLLEKIRLRYEEKKKAGLTDKSFTEEVEQELVQRAQERELRQRRGVTSEGA
eukprot:gene787-838_t